jgi:uncharacterized damage-inducible protein DinB
VSRGSAVVPVTHEEMNLMRALSIAVVALAMAAPASAQTGPMAAALKSQYELIKNNITKSAEKVPEDLYSFQATPKVRTFGQIVGHIADANTNICAAATSGTPSKESAEKTKTSKADLQKALADGFAACDAAFASMTDAKAAEMTKFFGGDQPRLAVLAFNTAHDFEHYGNLVTYMRLKDIVPPSSEGQR